MKFAYIDFEFNNTQERKIKLVSCSILIDGKTLSFWLHNNLESQASLKKYISDRLNYVWVSYAVEAEARSFIALNLHPLKFKWLDLYLEYRQIVNHSGLSYGKHLIGGQEKVLTNPLSVMNKENISFYEAKDVIKEKKGAGEIERGLAAACYKLLGIRVDLQEKEEMRAIIIASNAEDIEKNSESIVKYCENDVKYLPDLLESMLTKVCPKYLTREEFINIAINRANYSARTAIMVTNGYPVDIESLNRLTENIPKIMQEARLDINKVLLENNLPELFKEHKYVRGKYAGTSEWNFKQKETIEYILQNYDTTNWEKTDKGAISLSEDALHSRGASKHNFKPTVLDQLARWKALESSLRGLKEPVKATNKTLFDHIGSDARIRPYFGIFGSQSSRSQQTATSFIFLKSAWVRCLVQPAKGFCIIGADYSSQEFLLSAVISKDKAMEEAYNSGDVYLNFACTSGIITDPMPKFGTPEYKAFKSKFDNERNTCKSLVLGLSYMMGAVSLARKLTQDSKTGREYTVDEAKELKTLFHKAYPLFTQWQEGLITRYREYKEPIVLPCGWKMYGQNPNFRSVGNFPIQGTGASIMRKAVELCQDSGLKVIMTLHDAIYVEAKLEDEKLYSELLNKYMKQAFKYYFPNSEIRVDTKSWGFGTKSPYQIDPRGLKEWATYYEYVNPEWVNSVTKEQWVAAVKKIRSEKNIGFKPEPCYTLTPTGVEVEEWSQGYNFKSELDGTRGFTFKELIPHLNI